MKVPKKTDIPNIHFRKKAGTSLDFDIFTLRGLFNRTRKLDHDITKPHRVHFYHIFCISEGEGHHIIDFKRYTYNKGTLLFVAKNQIQNFEINDSGNGWIILFTEKFLDWNLLNLPLLADTRLFNYHVFSPVIQEPEDSGEPFSQLCKQMLREYRSTSSFGKSEVLKNLLSILLIRGERLKKSSKTDFGSSKQYLDFMKFRNLVVEHFHETRNVHDYAEMMSITPKKVNLLTQAVLKKAAKDFIIDQTILEIKRLLAQGIHSIKEIAFKLHFDEPTNMTKFFRKHEGVSPKDYLMSL